jgi:hypothetical protein
MRIRVQKILSKGQRVLVRAYPDRRLERIVLREEKTYVLVCRPEVYHKVKELDSLSDDVMGFPKEDVLEVLNPTAAS